MFDSFGILTSEGIQKRWLKIITDSHRISTILPEHNLLENKKDVITSDLSPKKSEETPKKSEETNGKTTEMQQRKVKESKEKNSKVNKKKDTQKALRIVTK